ncbi:DEAD/DEAH box helicase [Granulibacter bethesdensis]|uniref:ATP-dependent RNA helicase n=1 Tax=Granulibacter bethesdensis (strain ATCC BAA-1260 / CGDNIH1) TaxID=391165 RepID=Q0BPB9_GRABC|nr:DEAD/DEAH box helicase [Granulibacter bethesdensis]ABI63334.1 ATP-dependent RNA helicase [Granulibacter bethesdensis CGDNIH1]APH53219.1 ATP-dependent RNA helicase [Granulibacter bethesdensis]APH65907.1 ATP-dependent RNA helicase [Granulibacter bethesdensis]
MTDVTFDSFGLAEPILQALQAASFHKPTPIQAGAIPPLLEGRDLLGIAQTGTGKTAAFSLPLLQHLMQKRERPRAFSTRALILAPTRELAVQIDDNLRMLGGELPIRRVLILGGVGRKPQVQRMQRGADIVIGTPGRICDLMSTNELLLDQVSHFVLDEADRMLDLGFMRDIRKVLASLPEKRQSLLFSATMPGEIGRLAEGLLRNPARVRIAVEEPTPDRIAQHVHFIESTGKRVLLTRLLADRALEKVIVFTRTKHGANRVAEHLEESGIPADAIHGNKSQNARQRALERFRSGEARVLVATDIAARGIDVAGVSHVVNFELPNEPESYVHRIGRTARAGQRGIAISFCDGSERPFLKAIEKLTRVKMSVAGGVESDLPAEEPRKQPQARRHRPRWRNAA